MTQGVAKEESNKKKFDDLTLSPFSIQLIYVDVLGRPKPSSSSGVTSGSQIIYRTGEKPCTERSPVKRQRRHIKTFYGFLFTEPFLMFNCSDNIPYTHM